MAPAPPTKNVAVGFVDRIFHENWGQTEQGRLWAKEPGMFLPDLCKRSKKGTKVIPGIAFEKQK